MHPKIKIKIYNLMKKILLICVFLPFFSGCEKDDICDANTPTTPRLVIEFYDNLTALPTRKNVVNLGIIAPELTTGIAYSGVNKIFVPLKINGDTTIFNFIQNGATTPTTDDNTDVLTFNYARKSLYVSRACGFKTNFSLNQTNGIVKTEGAFADGFWIQNIQIVKSEIDNEKDIHVKIFF